MEEDDEIDILGDFSFNSCLAQNNQGIPSCSDRDDTVHPQWFLDSTANNWYDAQSNTKRKGGRGSRKISSGVHNFYDKSAIWSVEERKILSNEMIKYGRNIQKISQALKTKSEAEIQVLIDSEYGVNLETPRIGLDKCEDNDGAPTVVQEEIIADEVADMNTVLNMVTTGAPTIIVTTKKRINKINKTYKGNKKSHLGLMTARNILSEKGIVIGSTQYVTTESNHPDKAMSKVSRMSKDQRKLKQKGRKPGNHRRKLLTTTGKLQDNDPNYSKEAKKDSIAVEDSKSKRLQIVLGSGQAVSLSEGEEVVKIEKKKESDSESEVDVDVDSDEECPKDKVNKTADKMEDTNTIMKMDMKFEPMPKRRPKKINLHGEGGYTIMHTDVGDLYAIGAEPRRERAPKKVPVQLMKCRLFNADKPPPFEVRLHASALVCMDAHAHTSRAEVMGLVGGRREGGRLTLAAYRPVAAVAAATHCDMDPVSQQAAAESLVEAGLRPCGWHHSHPTFAAEPSERDLRSQASLQRALRPCLALITSQLWGVGRTASQFRCFYVEEAEDPNEIPVGYQFSVKVVPDLTLENLEPFINELRGILLEHTNAEEYNVNMNEDICPNAGITYLEKCLSSLSHHLTSAGYGREEPLRARLLQAVRDVYR